jgi:hypothetical protein
MINPNASLPALDGKVEQIVDLCRAVSRQTPMKLEAKKLLFGVITDDVNSNSPTRFFGFSFDDHHIIFII